jgi:hypothetical protein
MKMLKTVTPANLPLPLQKTARLILDDYEDCMGTINPDLCETWATSPLITREQSREAREIARILKADGTELI